MATYMILPENTIVKATCPTLVIPRPLSILARGDCCRDKRNGYEDTTFFVYCNVDLIYQ